MAGMYQGPGREVTMKLLLTSVFGPYAVDDEFGRKDNKMELFDNQITREQGIFSYRFNHSSFGLYFMAENIRTPTTVLDFPTVDRFIEELRSGAYTHVGISFIAPNLKKAAHMAKLVREHAPRARIILGGHGAAVENIEELVDCDHVCRGEGVGFLRELFKEQPVERYRHPLVYSAMNRHVMGVPLPQEAGVLIPGVGCPNRCRFCATAHFFGQYIPFLETGRDVYEVCRRYEEELGVTDFGVLDENFLKQRTRMEELVDLMEADGRRWTFSIFSSAETLTALPNLDILARMGVSVIWIGVESKHETYEKNRGIDFKELFAALQLRGISVLASTIAFLEHHDKETIWEDLDHAISLRPEYLQFMELGPLPGTALYTAYKKEGKLLEETPWEENHGQGKIWFSHPSFTREESEDYLRRAFVRDYETNGASFLRMIETGLRGYEYLRNHDDPRLRARAKQREKELRQMRYFLFASGRFSENPATDSLLERIRREYRRLLGRAGLRCALMSVVVFGFAVVWAVKMKLGRSTLQPPTVAKRYRQEPFFMVEETPAARTPLPAATGVGPRTDCPVLGQADSAR